MFKDTIRELRASLGLTQKELANKIQISHQAYSKYENGVTEPSIDTINKLAEIFGVSIDHLVGKERNNILTMQEKGKRINVLGSVPAGIPLEAIEDIVDWEEIPNDWRGEYFGLKIKGDSMMPKYIDGDTVIFKKQENINSGEEAIVYVNGYDATFKKIQIKETNGKLQYILQPLNNEYDLITVQDDETFSIVGVPVQIRRDIQ